MKTLFTNAFILTADDKNKWIKDGFMLVDGKTIAALGDGDELSSIQGQADQIVDLKGKWVMPGWINTHGHAAMSILRGFADDYPLQIWLEDKMWPMEAQFTAETVRWGTALAIVEMLKSGATCFVDMYDHMDVVAEVVEESGIRGVLTRELLGYVPKRNKRPS